MIGVSRNPRDFSRVLFRAFLARGYEVLPIHPQAAEIDGRPCAPSLVAVTPPVESVLLMTSPSVTEALANEFPSVGIKRVWMYRAVGSGAVSPNAVVFCEANGIDVVPGECPMMFLEGTPWFHRVHGLVRRIAGSYPR